jgi:hypothetical protein
MQAATLTRLTGQRKPAADRSCGDSGRPAADWTNTTIIRGDPAAAVRELKEQGDGPLPANAVPEGNPCRRR